MAFISPRNCGLRRKCQPDYQVYVRQPPSKGHFFCFGCQRTVYIDQKAVPDDYPADLVEIWESLRQLFSDDGWGTAFRHDTNIACDLTNNPVGPTLYFVDYRRPPRRSKR